MFHIYDSFQHSPIRSLTIIVLRYNCEISGKGGKSYYLVTSIYMYTKRGEKPEIAKNELYSRYS
jgi:hypothetical protein